eukprot:12935528-Prorocentrum_lima.AAC.1
MNVKHGLGPTFLEQHTNSPSCRFKEPNEQWSPLSSNGCVCEILKEILGGSEPMALREEHAHTE